MNTIFRSFVHGAVLKVAPNRRGLKLSVKKGVCVFGTASQIPVQFTKVAAAKEVFLPQRCIRCTVTLKKKVTTVLPVGCELDIFVLPARRSFTKKGTVRLQKGKMILFIGLSFKRKASEQCTVLFM